MIAALEEIAPGNAEILLNKLMISNHIAQTEDEVDLTQVDTLAECHKNASHWSTQRQILSIIADKVSYRTLQSWILGLTRYRFNDARQHAHMYRGGAEVETHKPHSLTTSLTSSQANTLSKNFHLVKGH